MQKRRILILDDDAAVGQTIQLMAEGLGCDAEFVTRAKDFFQRLDRICPDIITVDLVMPELDGVEIMRLLAERKCRARIIISSGVGTRVLDAAQRSAMEHGLIFAGVLSKPISREALRSLIGKESQLDRSVSPAESSASSEGLEITRVDLQDALDRREFDVVFQPKIEC